MERHRMRSTWHPIPSSAAASTSAWPRTTARMAPCDQPPAIAGVGRVRLASSGVGEPGAELAGVLALQVATGALEALPLLGCGFGARDQLPQLAHLALGGALPPGRQHDPDELAAGLEPGGG